MGLVTSREEEYTDSFPTLSLSRGCVCVCARARMCDVRAVRRQSENHEDLLYQKMTMLAPLSWTWA